MAERLAKTDWINQGLKTLANEGPGGLSIGPMATRLHVSRGSFYWHFRDIAEFRTQLLNAWQDRSTDKVIQELDANGERSGRLRALLQQAFGSERNLDRAIRTWAATNGQAAKVVASIDSRRIERIADLLVDAGVERGLAQHRASFLYWAYLGQVAVIDRNRATIPSAALDDICALFES